MLRFARLMRWPMVDSGRETPGRFQPVVRPATARSVSAIAEAEVNAG